MRKNYTAPRIESETVTEQASLACTVVQATVGVATISNMPPGGTMDCIAAIRKVSSYFDQQLSCSQQILDTLSCVVPMS